MGEIRRHEKGGLILPVWLAETPNLHLRAQTQAPSSKLPRSLKKTFLPRCLTLTIYGCLQHINLRKDKYNKKLKKFLVEYEDGEMDYEHDEEKEFEQSEDEVGSLNHT